MNPHRASAWSQVEAFFPALWRVFPLSRYPEHVLAPERSELARKELAPLLTPRVHLSVLHRLSGIPLPIKLSLPEILLVLRCCSMKLQPLSVYQFDRSTRRYHQQQRLATPYRLCSLALARVASRPRRRERNPRSRLPIRECRVLKLAFSQPQLRHH